MRNISTINRRRSRQKGLGSYDQGFSSVQLRPNYGQGPFTKGFQQYIPRKVDGPFYEFLREAIPIMDSAIWRLVSLDGSIIVEGDKAALVDEIQDWLDNVPVNDLQSGIQAFHQNFSNEAFEQGFSLSEFIPSKRRDDIIGLRVADSKFIKFKRTDKGVTILQRSDDDRDYRELKPDALLYWSIHNENQNPHGTPLFRSCEFVAQVLATMHNALLNSWERFGDPSFSLIYKTSRKDGSNHQDRCEALRTDLASAVRAKRLGQSADFVHAIDKDSDIILKIIGADGQELSFDTPARHVLEQIVSKTGLPAWMLGMHWSTTERLAEFESEMVLADIVTRQSAKLPSLNKIVSTLLKMRGRSWKKGDWELKYQQVNLHDIEKQARARFLNAQADMMNPAVSAAQPEKTVKSAYQIKGTTIDQRIDALNDGAQLIKIGGKEVTRKTMEALTEVFDLLSKKTASGCKERYRTIDWPELDKVEAGYETRLKTDWSKLMDKVMTIISLEQEKGINDGKFTFSDIERAMILSALASMLGDYDPEDDDSPVVYYYAQAYSLGLIMAVDLIGESQPILDLVKNREIYEEMMQSGFELVKNRATKRLQEKILAEMEALALAGANPRHVADRLRKVFDDANSDWERLARSEMSMAAEKAKLAEWKEWGVQMVEFSPAPDACAQCMTLAGDYKIDECPVPVQDTHPRCRCSIRPAASEV